MTLRQRQHLTPLFKQIGEQQGNDEYQVGLSIINSIEENGLSNKIVAAIITEKDKDTSPEEIEKFLDELTYDEFAPEVLITDFFTDNKALTSKLMTSLLPSQLLKQLLEKNLKQNQNHLPITSNRKSKTKQS